MGQCFARTKSASAISHAHLPIERIYLFFVFGRNTWRPRYVPQLGQAWCESRGFLHCGQATNWGRVRWWCDRRSPWRACEVRCFGNAPM